MPEDRCPERSKEECCEDLARCEHALSEAQRHNGNLNSVKNDRQNRIARIWEILDSNKPDQQKLDDIDDIVR